MSIAWTQVALAGVWGGLLALERQAFLQAMFSRPLVAATGIGLVMNDVASGLFVGMLLELFFLGGASLGASLAEHETLAATSAAAAAAAMASTTDGQATPSMWSVAILLFLPMGRLGRTIERALGGYSARLAEQASASAEAGRLRRAVRQNLWGMWPHFAIYGALTAAAALVGYALGPQLAALPPHFTKALAWACPAMGSVAAAVAAKSTKARRAGLYAGFAATAVTAVAALLAFWGSR